VALFVLLVQMKRRRLSDKKPKIGSDPSEHVDNLDKVTVQQKITCFTSKFSKPCISITENLEHTSVVNNVDSAEPDTPSNEFPGPAKPAIPMSTTTSTSVTLETYDCNIGINTSADPDRSSSAPSIENEGLSLAAEAVGAKKQLTKSDTTAVPLAQWYNGNKLDMSWLLQR
jgi:hypothetical protein